MFYVYILISLKDRKVYIGFTSDLKIRIKQHKEGRVKSTSKRLPIELIYYECYIKEDDAKRNEKYYKTTKGRLDLRKKLKAVLEKYKYGTIAQR